MKERWFCVVFGAMCLIMMTGLGHAEMEESDRSSYLYMKSADVKNPEKAIRFLKEAVDLDPLNAKAFAKLGTLYLKTKAYDEAKDAFSKAVEIDEEMTDALVGMSEALIYLGRLDEAVDALKKALEKRPHDPALKMAHGKACLCAGWPEKARASFHWIMMMYPGEQDGYLGLAEVCRETGHLEYGREILNKGLDVAIHKEGLYRGLGLMAEEVGDLPKAVDFYKKAIATSASDTVSRRMMMWCYLEMKEWENARDAADRLRSREIGTLAKLERKFSKDLRDGKVRKTLFGRTLRKSEDAELLMGIGLGLLRADIPDRARPFLEKAVQLGVRDPSANYFLGKALGECGLFPEAEEALFSALGAGYNPMRIRVELSRLKMKEGNEDMAIMELKIALQLYPDYWPDTVILKEARESEAFRAMARKACQEFIDGAGGEEADGYAGGLWKALEP